MSDAPAAAVFCGDMCAGCKDDCAACATTACGDCGGCEHERELSRRSRVASAALALLQIGDMPLEFGFNPNQLRGHDGRFIKMGGRGSAGKGGLAKGSGLKNPRVDADGRPRASEGGGAGAGGADTRADTPGRTIAKRKYGNGDKVPLADGTEGTVVGGHHLVAGRPGMYVAVRPDAGGKLKEVAVDAIRKRQIREAEGAPAASASEPEPATTRVDALERNAEIMHGSDRDKWPATVKADLAKARRREAADAREQEAAVNKQETDAARARVIARAAEAKAAAEAGALPEDGRGPRPAGFTPSADKDWNLTQKRLGKRTARTDPDGELQVGDVVPTRDGKWAEVLGEDPAKFWERNGLKGIKVRDDAKSYVHGESASDIKARIEKYVAEKAWRDGGGSSDRLAGVAAVPVDAQGLRPGEPPLGEDGKYAKPTKQYVTYNGETYTRTSRNPYRYASVIGDRMPGQHGDVVHEGVWSWHRTAESASKGTLTGDQRQNGLYVKQVLETSFEPPANGGREINVNAPATQAVPAPAPVRAVAPPAPTQAESDEYNRQIEGEARMIRDSLIDDDTDSPFSGYMDKYKERELSDRLQELTDAREAGQSDKADRIAAQIRKILLDTETRTPDELPAVPGGAR